jgi:hypothetical protein
MPRHSIHCCLSNPCLVCQPSTAMNHPRVIDFDDGGISVRLDGKDLRVWEYRDEAERRIKMLCAREYVEGWCDGRKV